MAEDPVKKASPEEIREEYYSSLSDLINNSKPMINMLTSLAEDYIVHAAPIVELIEEHLQKVKVESKLPVLYLIDSIIKNVNRDYLTLFTRNIVNMFCSVFEKVDEGTRTNMWKLRQTWNEVFPAKKLYALDLRVHNIDPAWPISRLPDAPSNSIHKQKAVQQKAVPKAQPVERVTPAPAAVVAPTVVLPTSTVRIQPVKSLTPSEAKMKEEVLKKQNELIELQKKKLELELLQAKASLEQQQARASLEQKQAKANLERIQLDLKPGIQLPDSVLQKGTTTAMPNSTIKPLEKQFSSAAAALLNKAEANKTGAKIAPASIAAVAAAKPSRDPRLKQQTTILDAATIEELARKKIMEQFKLQLHVKQNSVLDKTVNDKSSEGKKTNENTQKKSTDSSQRSSNKESKSSSKSSSSRSSSKSSSSSPRKSSSKSRSSKSSSSPLSTKHKLDESPPTSPEKRSKKSKTHKTHSPSPTPVVPSVSSYRIPRRSAPTDPKVSKENESANSSVAFKEMTSNARLRNYVRRNKDGSPDSDEDANKKGPPMPDASKDEDLRPNLAAALETKDLDLRVLTVPATKRQSSEIDSSIPKKSKADKFDALFGNEDVDLRTLTNPKAVQPPLPPPTSVSSDKSSSSKDNGWAKLKTPQKTERDTNKPLSDRNRDRSRSNLHNKMTSPHRRARTINSESDKQDDRNVERNIEIMMKQAAEQLKTGEISRREYNTLIQEVLHMSEDQKLRAAQRKEQEMGMTVWEKDSPNYGNEENIQRNTGPRGPTSGGPRWQGPWGPWAHPPPGFVPPGGYPIGPGPWGPRIMRSVRPDFSPFFNPRMGPPMVPNGPMMMPPNGPMPPIPPMNMPPNMMMNNGPIRPEASKRSSPNALPAGTVVSGTSSPNSAVRTTETLPVSTMSNESGSSAVLHSGELPPPDQKLLAEIAKDTMKSINIDGVPREIRYYGTLAIVFMSWEDPRDIGFQDGVRRVFIEGIEPIVLKFNDDYKEFTYEGKIHRIKLGTPTRELYIDDKWYECYFGGRAITIELSNKKVNVSLDGPIPQVKIGTTKRTDLVVGKTNIVINARIMVPVFLDAKPQMFEIEENQPVTLEFVDALETVLLNGRPFKPDFGGMPKPVIVNQKKHFIRFTVLPIGFKAGYVKILGMKGEPAKARPARPATAISVSQTNNVMSMTTAMTTSAAVSSLASLNVPTVFEVDTSSQDGMDVNSGLRSDSQIDVLSSVVPSAMAPSSGMSYQVEISTENPPVAPVPVATLPLSLNELFQRLVETGMVPNLSANKKQQPEEEKKEPEFIPISFDKPDTLKLKPAIFTVMYAGMQCSSCGERFAPEMASRYSHHLDWHFRQNRRQRDSTRKGRTRNWFYGLDDWIEFEEIEDCNDKAPNWFEAQKQSAEGEAGSAEDAARESEVRSVPTGSDEDAYCQVCHEAFEQFYNEEKEEWHLKHAVNFEDKNYHPLCLEDHKKSLEKTTPGMLLEDALAALSAVQEQEEEEMEQKPNVEDLEKVDIKVEKEDEDTTLQTTTEEVLVEVKEEPMDVDEELIEIIEPEPKVIVLEEIPDSDDEDQTVKGDSTTKDEPKKTIEDKPEEKIPDDVPLVFDNVKVKEEPLDDYEPGNLAKTISVVDTTQVEVKSSIDGNVELDSATSAMPTAPSKIKINITKPLIALKELEKSKKQEKKPQTLSESAPAKPLIPAAIKPALQGKKLSILPTVEKGHELSGLCSIM